MSDAERYERPLGQMVLASEHDTIVAKLEADLAEANRLRVSLASKLTETREGNAALRKDYLVLEDEAGAIRARLKEENAALRDLVRRWCDGSMTIENVNELEYESRQMLERASAEEGSDD